MFQQTSPVFLPPDLTNYPSKKSAFAKLCLLLVLGIFCSGGLFAKNTTHLNLDKDAKILSDTSIQASICNGQTYLFDGALLNTSGTYTATYPLPDGSDSVVTLQLTVLPLSFTDLNATICEGVGYPFNGQLYTQAGEYTNILPAANGCDSIVTLHLKVLPPVKTNLSAKICDSTFYVFQGDTLTQSGTYTINLPSSQGCDSIVTLTLSVVPFFDVPVSATICAGDSYAFGDTSYSNSGVYTYAIPTAGGCDSILTLTLTVLPEIVTHQSLALCVGTYYKFYGDSLTENGIYEALLTAANGCDSTIVLDLSFVDFYETNIDGTICNGGVYNFDNDLLDAEGIYVHEYLAQGGCDSTVTLKLTALPVSFGSDQATICAGDSYEYNGTVLSDQGEYKFILDAANGCDSTVTFTLNVLPAIGSALEATICSGETYSFQGEELSLAGVYEAILTAANGCDSIVTLTLNVLPTQQTTLNAAICAGETYEYEGESLTDAGTYEFVFIGENGCDSTVNVVLTVHPVFNTELNASICQGSSYEFDGSLLSDAGTYTAVYSSEQGCDSTVTLVLVVLPVQNTAVEATICSNESYAFNGQTLTAAGTYTSVLTGSNGCDSTVVLTLNVLPTQSTTIPVSICEGTSYDYNGLSLTTAGDYKYVYGAENGCDSTVIIALTVLPVPTTSIAASICAGDAYDYNGELLTDAGDYKFIFDAANGCDSVVTVSINVLPLLSSTTSLSLCAGSSYVYNGDTLSVAGTYAYTFTGANGCDSTATLKLDFVLSFETNLAISICTGESYIFGNDTLSVEGTFSQLLTAQGGCDSLVNLTLSILPLSQSSTDLSICSGETYDFNGQILNESGTYTSVLTGANGCDSTAVLNLTILPLLNSSLEATICANESYAFNGLSLNTEGTYSAVTTGSNGCDSTVVLTLHVLPVQSSSISASICANETYVFYNQPLTQSGVYTHALQGVNGCDSIITLQLEVLPVAASYLSVFNCDGLPFEFYGSTLTQSGTYQFVFEGAGANGCDSIQILDLTIYPVIPPTVISATICFGESFNFYGTFLTGSGTYTRELASSAGCDSIIELHLTVAPVVVLNVVGVICEGESFPFNGLLLTIAGTYTAMYQSQDGCDSTVILNLAVISVNTNVSVQAGTITAQATNATYQWINCATNQLIAGATNNSFTPSVTGNYAVQVTQNNCTATSNCVFVQVVSTNEPLSGAAWEVQPNPANDYTTVRFSVASSEALGLEVLDMAGRSLIHQQIAAGTREINLNLNDMPDGMLIVRLVNEHGVSAKKLMKGQN